MKEKWFVREFDPVWVRCRSCKKLAHYASVKRKNKCPHCKMDNYGQLPKKKGEGDAKSR